MPRGNPPLPTKSVNWLKRTGLVGIYLFCGLALLGITPATFGLVLLSLAFLIDFREWRALGRDPVAVSALIFALYVALHSLVTYLMAPAPALAEAAARTGADWIKLLLFIPFAYWAGGRPERIRMLLLLALIGFAVGALRKIDWAQFDATFFSTRFEVYLPAIAFGMFAGLGALGLIALREHFLYPSSGRTPRWGRIALWLLLLGLMLEGLLLSYSRGCWLSFAIAAALLLYLEWRGHRRAVPGHRVHRGARIAAAAAVAIALAMPIAIQHKQIDERLQAESETYGKLLSGDLSEVPSTSVGLRVQALRYAADLWSQRPWLGWGAGSSRYLLAHSNRPELIMTDGTWLPHLHNTYAEILVQLGIVGFALLATLVWLLVKASAASCRSDDMPGELCRLLAASFVFVLIWNLAAYRFVRHDYGFFWIIFAGTAYSFRLRRLIDN